MKRRWFLTASATLAAATQAAPVLAGAIPGGEHLVERQANFDERAFAKRVGRPAKIRQLWEAVAFKPLVWNNLKNAMNGLQFGFGYPASGIAMVFAGHGPSAAYGYSDYVWKKYRIGEFFSIDAAGGTPVAANLNLARHSAFNPKANPDDAAGMYQDASIEMLQQRGLVMLTCHTAVEEQSRAIVAKGLAPSGMSAQAVADDILTHLIAGAIVVPSMVATVAVLQAVYGYTYTTLTF